MCIRIVEYYVVLVVSGTVNEMVKFRGAWP